MNYFQKQIIVVSFLILIVLGLGIFLLILDANSYIIPGSLFIALGVIGLVTAGIIYVKSNRLHPLAQAVRLASLEIF
jgi:archaellum biogenesis protein FlaJ (TadC family)